MKQQLDERTTWLVTLLTNTTNTFSIKKKTTLYGNCQRQGKTFKRYLMESNRKPRAKSAVQTTGICHVREKHYRSLIYITGRKDKR